MLRVPGNGPRAPAWPPNDFADAASAQARIDESETTHRKAHHTHLEIARYSGDRFAFMAAEGILY